jgi:hypothetical protein
MRTSPRINALLAAGLAGSLAAFELIRLGLSRGVTPGYTLGSSLVSGLLFALVLAAAAIGLVLQKPFGWTCGVFGVLAATGYGIAVRAGGSWVGAGYMLAGVVLFALLVKCLPAFRSEDLVHG